MKKFLQEFKEFALKGNVMDMAIGVIIGAAFGSIVSALTDNFINPLIALITGGANFLIIALILFCLIKAVNTAMAVGKKKEEEKPAEPPKEEVLLTEIRDLLKERK